jgi:uncharacterized protein
MRTIAKLFGRSPFIPLQAHMDKVAACVGKVPEAVAAFIRGDGAQVEELAVEISRLEHQADQVKDDIRTHLPKSLFLPVDRGTLLEMLGVQDSLADSAENIAVLLTIKPLPMLDTIREDFEALLAKNLESFQGVRLIIQELGRLLESGFGGAEAEHVKNLVQDVAFKEHEADLIQRRLFKTIMAREDDLTKGEFYLYLTIIPQIAALSNLSEKLANRVRMTLEIK